MNVREVWQIGQAGEHKCERGVAGRTAGGHESERVWQVGPAGEHKCERVWQAVGTGSEARYLKNC
jgi:hypothetical protein